MNRSSQLLSVAIGFALCGACDSSEASEASEQVAVAEAPADEHAGAAAGPSAAEADPAHPEEPGGASGSDGVPVEGGRLFGQALSSELTATPLDSVLAEPAKFDGQIVKTEGAIERVCQKMGCWMELKCDTGSVRVPMAGHSFFLPKDAAGKRATVEGRVGLQELSQDAQEHLKAEGAQQVAALNIAATGVLIQ